MKSPASRSVRDPEFGAGQTVRVAIFVLESTACEREGVASGIGLRERVSAYGVSGEARQIACFLLVIAKAHDGVVDESVLDIDTNAEGGVDAGDFLDRERGHEKLAPEPP